MKNKFALFPVIMLFIINGLAFAQTSSPKDTPGGSPQAKEPNNVDKALLIRQVMDLTQDKKQIDQIPDYVEARLMEQQAKLKPPVYKKVHSIMLDSFKSKALYESVIESFEINFDKARLIAMRDWLLSPLARKMYKLEIEASSYSAAGEIEKFAAQLESNPASDQRSALIRRLETATDAIPSAGETVRIVTSSLLKAIERFVPEEKRLSSQQIEEMIKDDMRQFESSIADYLEIWCLYAYKPVSDEELKEYVEFWESDQGRWFTASFRQAMRRALETAQVRITKIDTQIPNPKSQTNYNTQ